MSILSKTELSRYSRHVILPEFNIEGQEKLKNAKVVVIGAGGLGAPLLQYLTAAGIGKLGIVEFDTVDNSNLQRQVLFTTEEVGESKALSAKERLQKQNPHIEIVLHEVQLSSNNALEILKDYDVVADGSDNFATRYLVNDACVILDKPLVYGSIFRFDGQLSVFNYKGGPNYRDLFPTPPPPDLVPNCAEGGVLGVLPGIIGSLQANEVIKIIAGIGEPLSGKLMLFDALSLENRVLNVPKNPDLSPVTELIDYEEFCGLSPSDDSAVTHISVETLHEWMQEKRDFSLIDVREPYEYEIANIGGTLIPKNEIENQLSLIPKQGDVVVYCRSGKRSEEVIRRLQKHGFSNLLNLKGGILEWAKTIDPEMTTY